MLPKATYVLLCSLGAALVVQYTGLRAWQVSSSSSSPHSSTSNDDLHHNFFDAPPRSREHVVSAAVQREPVDIDASRHIIESHGQQRAESQLVSPTTTTESEPQSQPWRVVVHVGPHKTGSTSAQMFWYNNEDAIRADHFALPHHLNDQAFGAHKTVANLAFCLQHVQHFVGLDCPRVLRATRDFLRQARRDGRNVLLSSEEFSPPTVDWGQFRELLLDSDDDDEDLSPRHQQQPIMVDVLVVYRRFYDYFVSLHGEINKKVARIYENAGIRGILNRATIPEWMVDADKQNTYRSMHSVELHERIRHQLGGANHSKYFDLRTHVYNMHAPGDYLSTFVCELPHLFPHTCQRARDQLLEGKAELQNRGFSLDAELIFAEGHRQQLINWEHLLQRKQHYDSVRERLANLLEQENSNNGDPTLYTCLNESQKREVLQSSKKLEERIIDSSNGSLGLDDIESDFNSKLHQFCSVNATAWLQRYPSALSELLQNYEASPGEDPN